MRPDALHYVRKELFCSVGTYASVTRPSRQCRASQIRVLKSAGGERDFQAILGGRGLEILRIVSRNTCEALTSGGGLLVRVKLRHALMRSTPRV